MPMMTSQILKSLNFTKTQKSRYLKNKTLFFLEIKKIINCTSGVTLWQKKVFVAEVTFNIYLDHKKWYVIICKTTSIYIKQCKK